MDTAERVGRAGRSVLVVEDDRDCREILCRLLRALRHDPIGCETVAQALSVLAERPIDRAVLDLMLPDRSGVEVLRFIRQSSLDTKVAILSGHHDPEEFPGLAELRPDVILRKPVDVTVLDHWLDGR